MNREERNRIFLSKAYLIDWTIRRHWTILRACRLERDDVYQELAVSLLGLLERYDPARCPNLDAWLSIQLWRDLLDLRPCGKRYGIPCAPRKGFTVFSLDEPDSHGIIRELPDTGNYANPAWIEAEIERLPPLQRSAVNQILAGRRVHPRNRHLTAARLRIRQAVANREQEWGGVGA